MHNFPNPAQRILLLGRQDAASSPPVYSSLSLPGLTALYQARAGKLWQDVAGTVPAAADGDPVGRWDDAQGGGFPPAIQAVSAARPTLRISGGLWAVVSDGADDRLVASGVALGQSLEMLATMTIDNAGLFQFPLDISDSSGAFAIALFGLSTGSVAIENNAGTASLAQGYVLGQITTYQAAVASGAGTGRFGIGAASSSGAVSGPAFGAGLAKTITICAYTGGGLNALGHFYEVAVVSAPLSAVDRAAYLAYTTATYGAIL